MHWARRILVAVSLVVVLFGVAIILLFTIDLGRFKSNLQNIISDATNREFVIGGRFEPNVGDTIDLVAEDIRLANAEWGTAENILELKRVVISIDTWSLLSGPIEVLNLEVEGLTLHVEKDPETLRSSWTFGDVTSDFDDAPAAGRPFELPLLLRDAQLTDISVTYGQGWLDEPRTISITDAAVSEGAGDLLTLELAGAIDSDPLHAVGLIGPLAALLDGKEPRWELQVTIGEFLASTTGSFDDLFSLDGPQIHAIMKGPFAERLLAQVGLPPLAQGPVDISGELSGGSDGIDLRLEGAFGNLTTDISGRAESLATIGDLDLSVNVRGPDLQAIGALFGAGFLPSAGFSVDGDISIAGNALTMESVALSAGAARLDMNGKLTPVTMDPDARLRLSASGPEILDFLPPVLADGIPSAPFEIQATVAGELQQANLRELSLLLGEDTLRVELDDASIDLISLAQAPLALDGQYADIAIHGQDLQALLEPWVDVLLPAVPFSMDGRVTATGGALQLSNVTYRLDQAQGTLNGTSGQLPHLEGLAFESTLAGPDASQFMEVLGDPENDIRLPADDFETHSSISKGPDGWLVSPWKLRIGESRFEFSGSVGGGDSGAGVDIDFVSSGPDLRRFFPDRGIDTPVPFRIVGGLEINETTIELQEIDLRIGETTAWLNGRLPASAEIMNAQFDVRIAGPNLQKIGRAFGIRDLPDEAYRFEGAMKRSGQQYIINNMIAMVGDNDLTGDISLEMGAKPRVTGRLDSQSLNLTELLGQDDEAVEPDDDASAPDRLIPDTPLPLHVLDIADIDVTLRLHQLDTGYLDVGAVELTAIAANDKLHIDTSRVSLTHGGTLTGSLDLVRTASDRADVQLSANAKQFRMRPPVDADGSPVDRPPRDMELQLSGSGGTIRELAASADGTIDLRLGKGDIDNQFRGFLMRDFVKRLFSAINPMAEESKYTKLNCGFVVFDVVDGIANSRAIGFQTDQLAVASLGTVNLATEALELSFRIKQREGVGVSLAGVINPYIKVGGTMASPALQVDAKRGLLTGTVAFLTGGLSVLAKGVWDRYLSQDNYCQAVLDALDAGEIPDWQDESDNS